MLTFWCCRCLKNREAKDLEVVTIMAKHKTPRKAYSGKCILCNAKVFKLVKNEPKVGY